MRRTLNIGGWALGAVIGRGGNAIVRVATRGDVTAAFKLLYRGAVHRQARFRDEIEAMQRCADIPGVLPVFDSQIPTDDEPGRPWLAMGLATPIRDALGGKPSLREVIEALRDIARTLEKMHARGFSHRDIKPDNLFSYEGRWSVGDFGLADFEGKGAETQIGERIGPMHYIAPEMLNNAAQSDGGPADVFSLAKTLWVLATGQKFPLPGSYDPSIPAFRIGEYVSETRTAPLDRLIAVSTAFDPQARPTMATFSNELAAWLQPSPATSPSPIRIDTSSFAARLERGRAAVASAQEREHMRAVRREESGARLRERFRTLATDIETSLRQAHFDPVHMNIDRYHWGFEVTAGIPNDTTRLQINVAIDANDVPAICVRSRFQLDGVGSARASMMLWGGEVSFLDGGSDEDRQLTRLDSMVREELQRAVTTTLTLGLGRPTAVTGASRIYRVAVTDTDGVPVPDASVFLLAPDGVYVQLKTNENGIAKTGDTAFAPVTAFIAHQAYPSIWVAQDKFDHNLQVRIKKDGRRGSIATVRGWTAIPGLVGQVDFIHDTEGRMYVYAENIAIDGGKSQPVRFELGQPITLRDSHNTTIELTPQAVLSPCFLIDIAGP